MIENAYQDYLIEKPLCLIFWKLSSDVNSIIKFFQEEKDFEVREIKSIDDLIYWLKIAEAKIILLGINSLEEAKEIKDYIDKKLPIEKRRDIIVIYILPEVNTLNPKETFLLSANLVISEKHLSEFPKIYEKASHYWEILYKDFKKALTKYLEI